MNQPQVADLVWWLVERGFTRHVIGPVDGPRVVLMYYDWGDYTDVAHVHGRARADVARIPNNGSRDVCRPKRVVWHRWGTITDALSALRHLPPPGEPLAPTEAYEPPRTSGVPEEGPREALAVDPSPDSRIYLSNQHLPGRPLRSG